MLSRIKSAIRLDDTILRLGGDGYTTAMTWGIDNRQIVSIVDGGGWPEPAPNDYTCRLFSAEGGPKGAGFSEVAGFPEMRLGDCWLGDAAAPYYGLNGLSVQGRIYQFLSTDNSHYTGGAAHDSSWVDNNFTNAKLIYSPDNGRTWCNQDGSTPVKLESKQSQSRGTMVFFHEPQDAFSQLTFLQMGRDYQDNRDGYVYVYAPNGRTEGAMNELVMFRVPKERVLERGAYEYFAGLRPDGSADWVKDIQARRVVHTFPSDWVHKVWPFGCWLPSVVYNEPLGIYIMANSSGTSGDCIVAKPTYLGLWIAPNPWGPWKQIHAETAWAPANDSQARAAGPVIAPKWIAEDGMSFWLVWTDVQSTSAEWTNLADAEAQTSTCKSYDDVVRWRLRWRLAHPHFAFNTQRVDLVTA